MLKERRKFPRAEIKYRINIICEGSVILGEPKNFIFHTYTENIGEGGIKVILEKELKTASLVKLELYITTKKSLPIKCKGIVVWSKKANPEGTRPDLFITGFQFLELEKRDQEVIGNIVNRFLEKNRK